MTPAAPLAAGTALAATASPPRDLHDIASEFRELATSLRLIGNGLDQAIERAEDTHDARMHALAAGNCWNLAERRLWTRDEIDLSRDNELKRARETAKRTAEKALVELVQLMHELEGFWECCQT